MDKEPFNPGGGCAYYFGLALAIFAGVFLGLYILQHIGAITVG
jgi:hypothetical protein